MTPRRAIYDGKYDLACARAQDILELEPNNETALEIDGSAPSYPYGSEDKSPNDMGKSLEVNPITK